MSRIIYSLILCLFLPVALRAQGLDAAVDRILAGKLVPNGPGVAILVMKDGRPLLQKTVGFADVATKRPINRQTVFDLASVSKPITGLAIASLVEDGKLRLEDSVESVLPDFRVPRRGRAITIRDLLQHTSGLADYTSGYPGNDEKFAAITTELHLEWLNSTRPRLPSGRRFQYNNSNYTLLALIAERVSGLSFAEYCRRNVLRPARMKGSFVYDGSRKLPRRAASGYLVRGRQVKSSQLLTNITGDGNVYTSIKDLVAFVRAIRRNRILKAATLEEVWTNGKMDNGAPIRDQGYGYGLGWEIRGSERGHTGSWSGTSTFLVIDPVKDVAVAVMSNDERFDTLRVGEAIMRLVTD